MSGMSRNFNVVSRFEQSVQVILVLTVTKYSLIVQIRLPTNKHTHWINCLLLILTIPGVKHLLRVFIFARALSV